MCRSLLNLNIYNQSSLQKITVLAHFTAANLLYLHMCPIYRLPALGGSGSCTFRVGKITYIIFKYIGGGVGISMYSPFVI